MEISPEQLSLIKKHLKVEYEDEDDLIMGYADAAVNYVEDYCDGVLVTALTPITDDAEPPREVLFKPGIWQAMLLMVGHWYANREAATQELTEVPYGVDVLLFRHRKWH